MTISGLMQLPIEVIVSGYFSLLGYMSNLAGKALIDLFDADSIWISELL
jgi:ABC-type antimicrobial peptide transport system permease subunit